MAAKIVTQARYPGFLLYISFDDLRVKKKKADILCVVSFLTGLVDACVNLPRDAPILGESSCGELPRTPEDAHAFTKATTRKTNQRGKKEAV